MLVLTRHLNQSIVIGNDIEVIVVEIRGDQIRLGIKAPRNVTVHRKEVVERIEAGESKSYTASLGNLDQAVMSHQE